jgi:hypothetical protein
MMIEALFAAALLVAVPIGVRRVVTTSRLPVPSRAGLGLALAAWLLAIALAVPRGPMTAVFAGGWLLATIGLALAALAGILRDRRGLAGQPWSMAILVATGFLVVGAAWGVADRAGLRPFDFSTIVVQLTAVHFHVAGFLLTLAGALAWRTRPSPAAAVAVIALVVGMPLTALGFFGAPLIAWLGSILVATAGILIASRHLVISWRMAGGAARWALAVAGLALLGSMPLAIAYATGSTFGIGALDVPLMAAIHGGLNVVGFAIPAMVGWTLFDRQLDRGAG